MEFFKEYHRFVEIIIAGFDCSFTDLTINLLFPSIFILFLYFFLQNKKYYPNFVQNLCEFIYEFMYSFIFSQVGKKAEKCIPCLMALMSYIILLNLSNLFPWFYGATSQLAVNFSLAIIVFILVFYMAISTYGLNIFKHFILDVPLPLKPFLFVLELFSFLIRPLTLAARLSINVLVGHMLLHIVSSFATFLPDGIIIVFLIGLSIMEIFVSLLQAYIFIILACVYIAEMSDGH